MNSVPLWRANGLLVREPHQEASARRRGVVNAAQMPMASLKADRSSGLKTFISGRVNTRKVELFRTVTTVCQVTQEVLKQVEILEPRFISSLKQVDGRYQGLHLLSPRRLEVHLFLNQMGVFNLIDDCCAPGCAMLKLSDERKRSMSLWTEFITASGYLSAKKIRSRFTSLVAEAVTRAKLPDKVQLDKEGAQESASLSRLVIDDQFTVDLIPAFRCGDIWPSAACVWPCNEFWPNAALVGRIKHQGFDLIAKDPLPSSRREAATSEGDAWVLSFVDAERFLLSGSHRKLCLSILKTICDRHLQLPGTPVEYEHLLSLVLHECVKHPRECEWDDDALVDRVNGCFLQLISCLQCRRCPPFFLRDVDLFVSKSKSSLEGAAKQAWKVVREVTTNPLTLNSLWLVRARCILVQTAMCVAETIEIPN